MSSVQHMSRLYETHTLLVRRHVICKKPITPIGPIPRAHMEINLLGELQPPIETYTAYSTLANDYFK